ncbi:hypothetical protein NEF87_002265 [Candidatus Lokiarchaeum ossiferum]|uniref:PAC domain-containing protein n=1 Tax=Candidatus Lokiarchaeum ossiferum TaxID=2951803 RepID=A0ABY6HRF1_9ARCH|nr:hypothetical protein NEF87_002265 [Candidatus Lokiarchaeum sp. B-35]
MIKKVHSTEHSHNSNISKIAESNDNENRKNADTGLILDFMNRIFSFSDREKMIQKSLEFFNILFSPEKIHFFDIRNDTDEANKIIEYTLEMYNISKKVSILPQDLPELNQTYIWIDSNTNLILPVLSNHKLVGYLMFSNFNQSEFHERYLQLIVLLSKYWGHVFNNIDLNTQIRKEQERFQIVADHSSDWEVWFDKDGKFKYNSPSCKKISGYFSKNVSNFYDLMTRIIHPNDLSNWKVFLLQIDAGLPIEIRTKHPSGEIHWLQILCTSINNKEGLFLGYRGSIRDVTKRKEAEENVSILRGMFPICSFCKKIRSDQGYWNQIEDYIRAHSEAEFTHSVCPECAKREYGIDV